MALSDKKYVWELTGNLTWNITLKLSKHKLNQASPGNTDKGLLCPYTLSVWPNTNHTFHSIRHVVGMTNRLLLLTTTAGSARISIGL